MIVMQGRFNGPVAQVAVMVCLVGALLGCDRADKIEPGMEEREVRRLLGSPSVVETDKNEMKKFFYSDESDRCLSRAKEVLFYEYAIAKDASISIDNSDRVVCIRRAHFVIQVQR